jgi:hypothetical protein
MDLNERYRSSFGAEDVFNLQNVFILILCPKVALVSHQSVRQKETNQRDLSRLLFGKKDRSLWLVLGAKCCR